MALPARRFADPGSFPDRLQHGTEAHPDRPEVGDLVHLDQAVDLAFTLDDFPHLIGGDRVQAAAEGGDLQHFEMGRMGNHLGHGEDPICVGPLGQDRALLQRTIGGKRYRVLRNNVHAESREELRESVVDQRIGVVRPAGNDHGKALLLPCLFHQRGGPLLQRTLHLPLRFEPPFHGLRDPFFPDPEPLQKEMELLFQQRRILETDDRAVDRDAEAALRVDRAPDNVGVTGHDGAVEAVLGIGVLPALEDHHRVEDPVHPLLDQIEDMAVGKLSRKTDVIGHHRPDTLFEEFRPGRRGENHPESAVGQQCTPERKVFIQVQHAWDAEGEKRRPVEDKFETGREQVFP